MKRHSVFVFVCYFSIGVFSSLSELASVKPGFEVDFTLDILLAVARVLSAFTAILGLFSFFSYIFLDSHRGGYQQFFSAWIIVGTIIQLLLVAAIIVKASIVQTERVGPLIYFLVSWGCVLVALGFVVFFSSKLYAVVFDKDITTNQMNLLENSFDESELSKVDKLTAFKEGGSVLSMKSAIKDENSVQIIIPDSTEDPALGPVPRAVREEPSSSHITKHHSEVRPENAFLKKKGKLAISSPVNFLAFNGAPLRKSSLVGTLDPLKLVSPTMVRLRKPDFSEFEKDKKNRKEDFQHSQNGQVEAKSLKSSEPRSQETELFSDNSPARPANLDAKAISSHLSPSVSENVTSLRVIGREETSAPSESRAHPDVSEFSKEKEHQISKYLLSENALVFPQVKSSEDSSATFRSEAEPSKRSVMREKLESDQPTILEADPQKEDDKDDSSSQEVNFDNQPRGAEDPNQTKNVEMNNNPESHTLDNLVQGTKSEEIPTQGNEIIEQSESQPHVNDPENLDQPTSEETNRPDEDKPNRGEAQPRLNNTESDHLAAEYLEKAKNEEMSNHLELQSQPNDARDF